MKIKKDLMMISSITLFLVLFLNNNIFAHPWEMGLRITDGYGKPIIRSMTLYQVIFTSYGNKYLLKLQTSFSDSSWRYTSPNVNGAADVDDPTLNTPNPTFSMLSPGRYYLVMDVDNKYCDFNITHLGTGQDYDFIIGYSTSTNSFSLIDSRTNLTWNGGNFTWSLKDITLKNKFGSDYSDTYHVKGNISLDDTTFSFVSYNDTVRHAESSTFPHYVVGQDLQNVYNYVRKWRKWEQSNKSSICDTLGSVSPYTRTATYAKQVTATVNKNYSGGYVTVNNVVANPTANMYDDITNNVSSSPQGYTDGLYYELSYWTYNGSNYYSNPLQISNPSNNVTIGATFTRRPDNAGKNVHFSTTVGSPIVVYWTDNVNTNVATYYVYRKVYKNGAWGPETLMATLNRGVQQFQDPDYLLANYKQYDLINYDVREYFTTDTTYSYPDWYVVYGQLYSIYQNSNMAASVNMERPTEVAISNYPNPFNPTTTINYQLPENGFVTIKIYDVLGKEVATLVNENKSVGYYNISFDANKLTSGVYIYTINVNGFTQSKKMLLMK